MGVCMCACALVVYMDFSNWLSRLLFFLVHCSMLNVHVSSMLYAYVIGNSHHWRAYGVRHCGAISCIHRCHWNHQLVCVSSIIPPLKTCGQCVHCSVCVCERALFSVSFSRLHWIGLSGFLFRRLCRHWMRVQTKAHKIIHVNHHRNYFFFGRREVGDMAKC